MKENYSRETLFFNLVSELAICLPKSSFFLSFNPCSLKPCRIFQTSPLLFLNLLWTIPSSLILQKSVLPPRNLTLSKSPRFAWMVTTFWDGLNQFECTSKDVERWATWRVKRRLLQWMIRMNTSPMAPSSTIFMMRAIHLHYLGKTGCELGLKSPEPWHICTRMLL